MFQPQSSSSSTYYDVLGIQQNSSINDIKRAYKELVLKYHPDKTNVEREEALEKFKELNQAYAILTNDDKRIIYDLYEKNKQCIQQIPSLNPNLFNVILNLIEDESDSEYSEQFTNQQFGHDQPQNQPNIMIENQDQFLNANLRKVNEEIGYQMSSNIRMFSQYIIDLMDSDSDNESQIINGKKYYKNKQQPSFEDQYINIMEPNRKKIPLLTKQNIRDKQGKIQQQQVINNLKNKKEVFSIIKKQIKK